MASKRRNMFHKNKTQETTGNSTRNLPPFCELDPIFSRVLDSTVICERKKPPHRRHLVTVSPPIVSVVSPPHGLADFRVTASVSGGTNGSVVACRRVGTGCGDHGAHRQEEERSQTFGETLRRIDDTAQRSSTTHRVR
ncbi:hypothetical protein AAG570_001604 [Ranatra chinensis]|uniref:Uncharacterized protein n=1 Tax=Ranatra chinensis TaxID=642074 RepID=A0ABD0YVJ6_9HEMI